jgi:hypothetical protein
MIKRTLFFGNPAYLSTKNEQIVISNQAKFYRIGLYPIRQK